LWLNITTLIRVAYNAQIDQFSSDVNSFTSLKKRNCKIRSSFEALGSVLEMDILLTNYLCVLFKSNELFTQSHPTVANKLALNVSS